MSRVGKMPIAVPQGVDVKITPEAVTIKGSLGSLSLPANGLVTVTQDGATLKVAPANASAEANAMSGTFRALLNNTVNGVSKGFEKKLEITGVGYRAALQGKNLQLALGYSHDVVYAIPEGITITVPKPTEINVAGIDSQRVGQVAAEIRSYRPPEPYKGKGVRYSDEFIFRKEGKKK